MGLIKGLSVKETMLLSPGTIFDLWELYKLQHGIKHQEDDE